MPVFSIRGTFSIRRKGLVSSYDQIEELEEAWTALLHHRDAYVS